MDLSLIGNLSATLGRTKWGLEGGFSFYYSLFGLCNVSDDRTLLLFTGLFAKGLDF